LSAYLVLLAMFIWQEVNWWRIFLNSFGSSDGIRLTPKRNITCPRVKLVFDWLEEHVEEMLGRGKAQAVSVVGF